ncbi:hypothetical protein HYS31_08215 [Candidatus Woesearchaeota archaeon]|nr:hypothetical protein [Candidatus Woesearchaeota archaeon]
MKIYHFLIMSIVSLFIVASCTANQNKDSMEKMNMEKDENSYSEFKKMCQNSGYEWMLMKPTQDGKFIKDAKSCWGCMVEGIEHVCDINQFNEINNMDSMQHMAMAAHAGTRSSVDVHMYKVGFIRPDVQLGKEGLLKFTINDMQLKKPVSDLEIVHDKIMHVVLVRNDLKHFDHVHAEMTEPGVFAVPYKFSSSGTYRIWVDFTVNGMQHIVDFDINVPGSVESEEKDTLGWLKVNFISSKEIAVGKETELKFEIFDKSNNPAQITEKFLAANAHLIAIGEALEEFSHNHDENFDGDNNLIFRHTFTESGKYRLWAQFLAEGKVRTAGFDIVVK